MVTNPLNNDDVIKEYFEQEGLKYGISLEHFTMICKAPFMYFRKVMERLDLPIINVKFFGKFLIYPARAKALLNSMRGQFERGEITEEFFTQQSVILKTHIDEYEAEGADDSSGEETSD